MPTARKLLAGLALALTAISCSDDRSPTAPTDQTLSPPTAPKTQSKSLLTNRAVTGDIEDGRHITGTVTVTKFNYTQAGGLTVDGVLTYTVTETGQTDTQPFTKGGRNGRRIPQPQGPCSARQGTPRAP